MTDTLRIQLRPTAIGMTLAVLTILFGQFMGIVFGLNEEAIKSQLESSATQVRESVYKNDEAAMKKVQSKSWSYMKRAHLHAGGMGTTALAFIVLIGLLGVPQRTTKIVSIALGAGGFGYSVFWMWAGFRAPGLGSTGLAKESLRWLAMPSSGGFVLASVAVLVLVVTTLIKGGSSAVGES